MCGNSVFDAVYMAAHEYPGGARALAARIAEATRRKVSWSVLAHQLNPNDAANPLTVRNLNNVIAFTGNNGPVHAFCLDHGFMAIPLPEHVADETTSLALTETCKEFADYLQSVTNALKDERVTALELRGIRKELGELVASAGRLDAIVASMEASRARKAR